MPELRARGLAIGVVKHHSHTSSFDVPGKDTFRMAAAGADVVVGISAVQVAVFRANDNSDTFEDAIYRHCAGMDLVLTEGYKRGPFPKIEVHRSARSDSLLCASAELLALVTDRPWDSPVRQFDMGSTSDLADFLVDWAERQAAGDT